MNRPIEISGPLKDGVLIFRRMRATEELGRLFEFDLELLSKDGQIKFEDVLGQAMTVRLELAGRKVRCFNGLVNRFAQVDGEDPNYFTYRASLRPWLWFLTRTADCRIFQGQTVPDIIKSIFREHGFTDFEESLSGSYRTWEYCVQYRETDFNFVSRLMEQEGIYYYFKHEDGKHSLVLSDSYSSHDLIAGYEEVPYHPPEEQAVVPEHVYAWSLTQQVEPGAYALNDFDFEKPKASLQVTSSFPRKHAHADYEVYDYPGEYLATGEGDTYARVREEELQAQYEQVTGEGDARGLAVGGLFSLTEYPREDQNREYLIASATCQLELEPPDSAGGSAAPLYTSRFVAIPSKQQFRTSRLTPKPVVQGPQTAVVVGKSGEEIWTDKYGRVKVQFHWDRLGKMDENSSCWIRVAQYWAGKGWGAIHIPRMGQEVIVEFLEGDPDRPIVTGRVYNADCMPPYGLPANATQSGIKSRSSKGGGADNCNEIRFEDKKGEEEVLIHAEKDQTIEVENDESHSVGNDRSKTIGHDETSQIGNNRSIQVGANHTEVIGQGMSVSIGSTLTETVGTNYAETVGAAMEVTVGAAMTITVGAAMAETVGGAKAESIGAAKSENIGKTKSVNVGENLTESIGKSRNTDVGGDLEEKVGGKHKESVTKEYFLTAKKIQLVGEDEINIKTGSAEIVMKKNGDITMKGKKITVKGSGDVIIKGSKVLEN